MGRRELNPALPSGIIKIPNPPELEDNPGQMIAQALLPMAMIFGYILVAAFGQTGGWFIMIPMLLSVVASVALAFYINRQQRKKLQRKELNYKLHINDLRRQMESDHEQHGYTIIIIIPIPKNHGNC